MNFSVIIRKFTLLRQSDKWNALRPRQTHHSCPVRVAGWRTASWIISVPTYCTETCWISFAYISSWDWEPWCRTICSRCWISLSRAWRSFMNSARRLVSLEDLFIRCRSSPKSRACSVLSLWGPMAERRKPRHSGTMPPILKVASSGAATHRRPSSRSTFAMKFVLWVNEPVPSEKQIASPWECYRSLRSCCRFGRMRVQTGRGIGRWKMFV